MGKKKRRGKRGFPVAIVIGFRPNHVTVWKLFEERPVLFREIIPDRKLENADKSQLYAFHERLLDSIRPLLKSGHKSVILVSPQKTRHGSAFLDHLHHHQKWLFQESNPNYTTFTEHVGEIRDEKSMKYVVSQEEFKEALNSATTGEATQLIKQLEERLNDEDGLVLYSLQDIETFIYSGGKKKKRFKNLPAEPEYLFITKKMFEQKTRRGRIHRLLQIVKNRGIKTKVIDEETGPGERIAQLGGIVCLLKVESDYEKEASRKLLDA
ncbi:MAG: hypothetical protein ACFFCS_25160 [Candidatus Hodarchaeota archaeon]